MVTWVWDCFVTHIMFVRKVDLCRTAPTFVRGSKWKEVTDVCSEVGAWDQNQRWGTSCRKEEDMKGL